MKAWRKHNQDLTTKIAEIDEELRWYNPKEEIKRLNEKRKQLKGLYLNTKTERRGQFAAEVSQPSTILFPLFHNIGLPVPPELANNLNGKTINL